MLFVDFFPIASLSLSSLCLLFPLAFFFSLFCLCLSLLCHDRISGVHRDPSFLFPKAPKRAEAVSVAFSPNFQKLGEAKPGKGITGSHFTVLPSLVRGIPTPDPQKKNHRPN